MPSLHISMLLDVTGRHFTFASVASSHEFHYLWNLIPMGERSWHRSSVDNFKIICRKVIKENRNSDLSCSQVVTLGIPLP